MLRALQFLIVSLLASSAFALQSPVENIDQIIARLPSDLNLSNSRRAVRIAILDRGFRNYELEVGQSIPLQTSFHTGPVVLSEVQQIAHGTFMAQIISAVLDHGSNGQLSFELHLYSANDRNLEWSINDLVARHVDVVFYSVETKYRSAQQGHLSALISEVANSGALWIAASDVFESSSGVSVSTSPTSANITVNGLVELTGNDSSNTNSNAAAIVASAAAAYRSSDPHLRREQLLSKWNGNPETHPPQRPTPAPTPRPVPVPQPTPVPPQPAPMPPAQSAPGHGLPLFVLGFKPTGTGCFARTYINYPPYPLVSLLQSGATPVQTSKGNKVFIDQDPMVVIRGVQRVNPADMIVVNEQGYFVFSRQFDGRLPVNSYEVVETPEDQIICN